MENIIELLYSHKDEVKAEQLSKYLKYNFTNLGLLKPERAKIQRAFMKEYKKNGLIDWEFIFKLWDLPEREFQYFAYDLLMVLTNHYIERFLYFWPTL